jgi:hypothetical protein
MLDYALVLYEDRREANSIFCHILVSLGLANDCCTKTCVSRVFYLLISINSLGDLSDPRRSKGTTNGAFCLDGILCR